MKQQSKTLLLAATMLLSLFSCQQEVPMPERPTPKGREFSARYIIPLTTGRDNGETTIVDQSRAAETNVAELRPTIMALLAAAKQGKVPTYPPQEQTDPENDPSTYLQRRLQQPVAEGRPMMESELLVGLEIEYEGQAYDGYSRIVPRHFDFTFVDSKNIYPDMNVCRIYSHDLKGFMVKHEQQQVPLDKYLTARQFEYYAIRVYAPDDTFGIRTHEEAQAITASLDQGIITGINPWDRN